jgi:hypothetical protein
MVLNSGRYEKDFKKKWGQSQKVKDCITSEPIIAIEVIRGLFALSGQSPFFLKTFSVIPKEQAVSQL